ncbi:uncharacterized protein LOC131687366 [Topomyia yanbarensis]|uniref:uncharacterized protein LOC131687366 n=1 Tax=Topomyia yanbarensis TaxID=2498891 RepID=UPI00273B8470|nr:uncharacterized protein LOC131687366 [Topomyia yanbarensis]
MPVTIPIGPYGIVSFTTGITNTVHQTARANGLGGGVRLVWFRFANQKENASATADHQQSIELDPQYFLVTDSGISESSEPPSSLLVSTTSQATLSSLQTPLVCNSVQCPVGSGSVGTGGVTCTTATTAAAGTVPGSIELGHSRNSSNTSQMSNGSGYSSFSHSQHSRQSSEGDSGHQRNPGSSSIPMSETGSLDRMKSAAERRKKGALESNIGTIPTVSGRVEGTRVNTGLIIDELLKNTKLDHLEESATLGSHGVKSRMPAGVFKL